MKINYVSLYIFNSVDNKYYTQFFAKKKQNSKFFNNSFFICFILWKYIEW